MGFPSKELGQREGKWLEITRFRFLSMLKVTWLHFIENIFCRMKSNDSESTCLTIDSVFFDLT